MKINVDSLHTALESLRDQPDRLIEIIIQRKKEPKKPGRKDGHIGAPGYTL